MIPLSMTIIFVYGLIGFVGKDYDMPIAVLSSLSLGLAIDYAIHFLARSREIHAKTQNWKQTVEQMFQEPARAISRNIFVVGIGFLPLLLSPLKPYQTVGFFIAAILITAGIATLFIIPASITLFQKTLLKKGSN
jgi:predicted RND superfamily exporter protein